jgi:hypothetical protein
MSLLAVDVLVVGRAVADLHVAGGHHASMASFCCQTYPVGVLTRILLSLSVSKQKVAKLRFVAKVEIWRRCSVIACRVTNKCASSINHQIASRLAD